MRPSNERFLTMKFTGSLAAPRLDLSAYRRAMDKHLREAIAQALMAWLEATVLAEVPVWSGASRATFRALANHIEYNIPIFPVAPSRISRGEAESSGSLETDEAKGRYVFKYQTTLPWLLINEYFDATQWGFLRLVVTPSQIEGQYTGVDKEGNVTPQVDTFSTPVI